MTYVELIVVLSIFATMSSIVMFNYGDFQDRIDIRNLANDIGLKLVEAQKSATSGKFPSASQQIGLSASWKPSYGIYFNKVANNKIFFYFTDLDNSKTYEGTDCAGECVEKSTLPKGSYVSSIDVFYFDGTPSTSIDNAILTFTRPNQKMTVRSDDVIGLSISYVQITVTSSRGTQVAIKAYASGRIQSN